MNMQISLIEFCALEEKAKARKNSYLASKSDKSTDTWQSLYAQRITKGAIRTDLEETK